MVSFAHIFPGSPRQAFGLPRDDGMDANDKLGKLIDGFMEHEAPMNQNNPLKHKESIPWQSIK